MIEFHPDATDEESDRLFEIQIEETLDQAMRYPGRILPFLGVDTRRENFEKIMDDNLATGKCVGVKIYPSTGFPIYDEQNKCIDSKMKKVFEKCDALGAPIMMHCSPEGFSDTDCIDFASPGGHWEQISKEYKNLKICFAIPRVQIIAVPKAAHGSPSSTMLFTTGSSLARLMDANPSSSFSRPHTSSGDNWQVVLDDAGGAGASAGVFSVLPVRKIGVSSGSWFADANRDPTGSPGGWISSRWIRSTRCPWTPITPAHFN